MSGETTGKSSGEAEGKQNAKANLGCDRPVGRPELGKCQAAHLGLFPSLSGA